MNLYSQKCMQMGLKLNQRKILRIKNILKDFLRNLHNMDIIVKLRQLKGMG